ncbi:MAG TPA: hypothetical protein GX715_18430 [Armatimonadetes bacterium]|nr:hypothetical protein [Armatimonadota bacterium]
MARASADTPCKVVGAASGLEARGHHPGIVVPGLRLPVLDGQKGYGMAEAARYPFLSPLSARDGAGE